jgi:hypothetical protein
MIDEVQIKLMGKDNRIIVCTNTTRDTIARDIGYVYELGKKSGHAIKSVNVEVTLKDGTFIQKDFQLWKIQLFYTITKYRAKEYIKHKAAHFVGKCEGKYRQ